MRGQKAFAGPRMQGDDGVVGGDFQLVVRAERMLGLQRGHPPTEDGGNDTANSPDGMHRRGRVTGVRRKKDVGR